MVDLMECVDNYGIAQGDQGRGAILYQVTQTLPVPCIKCHFNTPRSSSCSHAPNHSDAANTGASIRNQQWRRHLQVCDEARTGILTDVAGNLITPFGHLDGS